MLHGVVKQHQVHHGIDLIVGVQSLVQYLVETPRTAP